MVLWIVAGTGAAHTLFWVAAFALHSIVDIEAHWALLLVSVVIFIILGVMLVAHVAPTIFQIPPSTPWRKLLTWIVIGAAIGYPVLAVGVAAIAILWFAARGGLHERDVWLAVALVSTWVSKWPLPIVGAVYAWRKSVHQ